MQADKVELLVPRHQAQAIIDRLILVGHTVVNNYSIEGLQVRRDGRDEEQRKRRNAYCARRALKRTLDKGNLGRTVTLFYEKKMADIQAAFPDVFTIKGQSEFDLEFGVHQPVLAQDTNSAQGNQAPAQARDNSVPSTK